MRTHNEEEAGLLRQEGTDAVFLGEEELARSMIRHVLERYGRDKAAAP